MDQIRSTSQLITISPTHSLLSLLPPPNGEGYAFISVGLCVSVYLSVSNITEKHVNGFS